MASINDAKQNIGSEIVSYKDCAVSKVVVDQHVNAQLDSSIESQNMATFANRSLEAKALVHDACFTDAEVVSNDSKQSVQQRGGDTIGFVHSSSVESETNSDDRACNTDVTDTSTHKEFVSAVQRAAEQAADFLVRIWHRGWDVMTHRTLPSWLRDNEYLLNGHRPELHSYAECFKSAFRIHSETGNIWTHLLGAVACVGVAACLLTRPSSEVQWEEKLVFGAFFVGAICCLGLSCSFHTYCCHSQRVAKVFAKLDYCAIALLIITSFVPWLNYAFYCEPVTKIVYLLITIALGITCIIVSLWDKFASPKYRPLRAGIFTGFGLSGVVPALHVIVAQGFMFAVEHASFGWLSLMASLYISGALIYTFRIPERLRPGWFDIWGQSHQIFHLFAVAAAFVHYHGIIKIATYRLTFGDCANAHISELELD